MGDKFRYGVGSDEQTRVRWKTTRQQQQHTEEGIFALRGGKGVKPLVPVTT